MIQVEKKTKRVLSTVIIVVIVILFIAIGWSGCFEKSSDMITGITAEELTTEMLEFIENITSYKYLLEGKESRTTIIDTESTVNESEYIQIGKVNVADKKLFNEITSNDGEYKNVNFIVDNILYIGQGSITNLIWEGYDIRTTYPWKHISLLESQTFQVDIGVPGATSEIRRLSDETINNKECYILYYKVNRSSSDYGSFDYKSKYWITKENYSMIKQYTKVKNEDYGYYNLEGKYEQEIRCSEENIIYYDFNIPITDIELPSDALDYFNPDDYPTLTSVVNVTDGNIMITLEGENYSFDDILYINIDKDDHYHFSNSTFNGTLWNFDEEVDDYYFHWNDSNGDGKIGGGDIIRLYNESGSLDAGEWKVQIILYLAYYLIYDSGYIEIT